MNAGPAMQICATPTAKATVPAKSETSNVVSRSDCSGHIYDRMKGKLSMSAHISHATGAARSNAGFLQKSIDGDDSSDGNDARAACIHS